MGKDKARRLPVLKRDIYALGMMAGFISFLGFIVENIWLAVTKGYINNRNMTLPFLFGYGFLVLLMYFMFGTPDRMNFPRRVSRQSSRWKRYAVYFLCAMLVVSIGEILLGATVEKLCSIEYWNYSEIPLHITKYTSIPTSAAFASMITLFMAKCFDPIMSVIARIDYRIVKVVGTVLMILMMADFFCSFGVMIKRKGFNLRWKIFL